MKKFLKIMGVFLVCIIFVIIIFKFTYSKYSKIYDVDISSQVATPVICFEAEAEKNVESLNTDVISYEFSVKNYNEIITETAFKYYISFEYSQENAPILVKLYRKNNGIEEEISLSENKTVDFETIELDETENFYRLEISYDKDSSEVMIENLKINVCIEAIQKEV